MGYLENVSHKSIVIQMLCLFIEMFLSGILSKFLLLCRQCCFFVRATLSVVVVVVTDPNVVVAPVVIVVALSIIGDLARW